MAATLIKFAPSPTANFQFQATFDGTSYNLVLTWQLYSGRYYISCYTLQGQLVYSIPLTASPDDYNISLNGGYFDTPMIYRASSGNFEIG